MAGKKGKFVRSGNRRGFYYFFLKDEKGEYNLYRKVHINVAADILTAYNYTKRRREMLPYAYTRKIAERAYTLVEAGELMNRTKRSMKSVLLGGHVDPPQMTHTIDGKPWKYLLSPDDVMRFWEHYSQTHYGHPRRDGAIGPLNLPTEREMRAKLRNKPIYYVTDEDGNRMPTWESSI